MHRKSAKGEELNQLSVISIDQFKCNQMKIYIFQMHTAKFERILRGEASHLSQSELMQFQGYCSARNFSLDQLIDASMTLYKVYPELSYSFLTFLDRHELSKPIYNDYQHQNAKITIYNNLTGLVLSKTTRESSKEEVNRYLGEAKRYLNSSEKVRMTVDKSIILNRAFLHYYAGEITKALNLVSRIYQQIQKTGQGRGVLVTATLMLAQIHFIKKNYQKSLDLYKKCLQINKTLPVKARIGMGYCFFYLGKYEMARACFQRIIKLNSNCVQAYIGIAVIYQKDDNSSQYFKYLTKAYQVNKKHPLVLLHLAEHFLFRKDLQKANKCCQDGLVALERYAKFPTVEDFCRNDYEELKARFNNLIGQIHHINSNFADAIKYYTLASGKGLLYNEILLAQAYINPNSQNYIQAIKLLDDNYKLLQGKDSRLVNDSYKLMAYLKSKVPTKAKDQKGSEFYYNEALRFNRNDFEAKIQYATNILVQTNKAKALKTLEEAQKIQLANGGQVKPQLQNNIAVLYLQNGEIQAGQKKLQKCLSSIENQPKETEQQVARILSLQIVAKFNYGICMQRQSKWYSARLAYEQVLLINKYHIDSAIRLAYVWYQLGSYLQTEKVLSQVNVLCRQHQSVLNLARIAHAKAYIQHLSGSSIDAKETLKIFGKQRDIYSQIFQICITYEGIMRKGVELNILKEFLRPNREFCYKLCRDDHNAAFAYMLLAIICLVDKKITKAQGIQFFNNLKQFAAQELPNLFYNMALFLMYYEDNQNSNIILSLYKEKVGVNTRIEELLCLNHLLLHNLDKAQACCKRNMLRQPYNLKFRLQYAYILQYRGDHYYHGNVYKIKEVEKRLAQIDFMQRIHQFISPSVKGAVGPQISKGVQCLQLKQRLKGMQLKLKNIADQRKFYARSFSESYQALKKHLLAEQARKIQEEIMGDQESAQDQEKVLQLQRMLQQVEQSEDEQQKERKQLERKKQRVLQIARRRQAEMDNVWNDLKQKDQQLMDEKKSKKRGPRVQPAKPTGGRKRQRPKEKDSVQYDQEPRELPEDDQDDASFKDQESEEQMPELDDDSQKSERHEKKHKKHKKQKLKKKHKHRREQEEGGDEDDEQVKSEKKKPEDKDDNDDQLMKYMI